MPNQPGNPNDKVMAGVVERLLRQLDPEPSGPAPGPARPGRAPRLASKARRASLPRPPALSLPSPRGVWARVALAVFLVGALTQWPYRFCGLPLAGYLAGATVVLVAGAWAGRASWRRRMGIAHVIAIAVIFAGSILAAHQVLPRLGYAPADVPWSCAP